MKRRDFSKFAAAGFVVGGAAFARRAPAPKVTQSPTPRPTSAPAPAPTTAPAPAPTTAPAPAPTTAPAPAPATASGLGYPFGARLADYVAGTKPSAAASTMDTALKNHYSAWKAARVVDASSIVAGGYAVKFSDS